MIYNLYKKPINLTVKISKHLASSKSLAIRSFSSVQSLSHVQLFATP